MPAANLDDKPALVLIDLQKGILGMPTAVAIADPDADSHAHSFGKIFPRLGEIATTDEVVAALDV
jgi:hypothetical protein